MDESKEHYVAPQPEFEELDWEDPPGPMNPKRVLWVEGYGFEDEVFKEVIKKINRMFQDTKSWVVADEPEGTALEAFEEAMELQDERRSEDSESE